jgi:hypothetical protein
LKIEGEIFEIIPMQIAVAVRTVSPVSRIYPILSFAAVGRSTLVLLASSAGIPTGYSLQIGVG